MDYHNQMNKEEILERYWNGETSLEEEKWLKANHEGSLFRYLNEEYQVQSNLSFDKLMNSIEALPTDEPVKPRLKIFSLNQWVSAIAACLIILAGAFFILRSDHVPDTSEQFAMAETYEDPEQAYQEVKEALLLISSKINQTSTEVATHISKAEPYTEIFK